MIKKIIKRIINSAGGLSLINRLNPYNRMRIKGNSTFHIHKAKLDCVDVQIHGDNNHVIINERAVLKHCTIRIYGCDNTIIIGENCSIQRGTFWIEDDDNLIQIGASTTVNGKTEFAAIEGTRIIVGNDCMFSSNITLRTGDSHSIIDENGQRTNPSADILVDQHVWVCADTTILKGVHIRSNSIVGTRSVVTKVFETGNVIIAGCPAQIIKMNTNWNRERILASFSPNETLEEGHDKKQRKRNNAFEGY